MSSELINNSLKRSGKSDIYWIIFIHRQLLELLNSTSLLDSSGLLFGSFLETWQEDTI